MVKILKTKTEDKVGLLRFELKSMAPEDGFSAVELSQLDEFIKLREIEGLSDEWVYYIRQFITDYLDFVKWKINKEKTLNYFTTLKKKQAVTSTDKSTTRTTLFTKKNIIRCY